MDASASSTSRRGCSIERKPREPSSTSRPSSASRRVRAIEHEPRAPSSMSRPSTSTSRRARVVECEPSSASRRARAAEREPSSTSHRAGTVKQNPDKVQGIEVHRAGGEMGTMMGRSGGSEIVGKTEAEFYNIYNQFSILKSISIISFLNMLHSEVNIYNILPEYIAIHL